MVQPSPGPCSTWCHRLCPQAPYCICWPHAGPAHLQWDWGPSRDLGLRHPCTPSSPVQELGFAFGYFSDLWISFSVSANLCLTFFLCKLRIHYDQNRHLLLRWFQVPGVWICASHWGQTPTGRSFGHTRRPPGSAKANHGAWGSDERFSTAPWASWTGAPSLMLGL